MHDCLLSWFLAPAWQQPGPCLASFRTRSAHFPAEDRPTRHRFDAGRCRCLAGTTTMTKDYDHG